MLREGMAMRVGLWKGRVWRLFKGHCVAIQHMPNGGVACDYKIVPLADVAVRRGVAIAPAAAELVNRRVAASWERAD